MGVCHSGASSNDPVELSVAVRCANNVFVPGKVDLTVKLEKSRTREHCFSTNTRTGYESEIDQVAEFNSAQNPVAVQLSDSLQVQIWKMDDSGEEMIYFGELGGWRNFLPLNAPPKEQVVSMVKKAGLSPPGQTPTVTVEVTVTSWPDPD
eukprot:TRINITY_DN18951_c0_g1_i1.p2 TRINITY_DN18951_c0_g1~~TRINITY_DN18951_c0_g1_i1.p2  ORF type:complete len:150 (+),score=23.81 TRINITY_DN18951_c0_g1_i1:116-565(+)